AFVCFAIMANNIISEVFPFFIFSRHICMIVKGYFLQNIPLYQYAFAKYTICFAFSPQHIHLSSICSSSKGIHLVVAPVSSFILSSHSLEPHHIALTNPLFTPSLNVSISLAEVVL